jgi:hypothetical protein
MSRESMMLLAGGFIVIAGMVLYYDNQHVGVKGLGPKTHAAIMQKQNAALEADDNDMSNAEGNSDDPAVRKLTRATKAAVKPQMTKEQFVAFDNWPSDVCTPAEVNTENTVKQSAQTGDANATSAAAPQSSLDDELKSTAQLYKGLAARLDKQGLSVTEYNNRVRRLQSEYDEKIKKLFQKKQKLDGTQIMINNGTISPEEGRLIMWKLVAPEEAAKTMPTRPKPAAKPPAPAEPVRGFVTGIMHSNEVPTVLIDGEIYNEGATVYGVRIAKIGTQNVEFEYNGRSWSQSVNDKPSSSWP